MTRSATVKQKKEILFAIRSDRRKTSSLTVEMACKSHGITKSTFYNWCNQESSDSLEPLSRKPKVFGNRLDLVTKKLIIELYEEDKMQSPYSVHSILKANGVKVSPNTVIKVIREYF